MSKWRVNEFFSLFETWNPFGRPLQKCSKSLKSQSYAKRRTFWHNLQENLFFSIFNFKLKFQSRVLCVVVIFNYFIKKMLFKAKLQICCQLWFDLLVAARLSFKQLQRKWMTWLSVFQRFDCAIKFRVHSPTHCSATLCISQV